MAEPRTVRETPNALASEQIAAILPHRYPFALVDRILDYEPGQWAIGRKCVSRNEEFFCGHFPGYQLHLVPYEDDHQGILGEIGALGEKFDFLIGACDSRQWLDRCNFLPLGEYRHCIAVPRGHPLAGRKGLTLAELHGETLMMVKQGDSPSVDRVRAAVEAHPQIHIEDTPQFYDMEVFNRSVQTGHLLMSLDCWTEVHPSLVTLPVDWNFTIPYGLLYQLRPGADVARFVALVRGDGPA